jgi:hypothetical protein
MTTMLMPLDPATSPQRVNRVLTISARLLPGEVIASRRARRMRAAVITGLVLVLALLGSWFAYAGYQTDIARDDLAGVNSDAQMVRQQQRRYDEVVNLQDDTKALDKQLSTLLSKDLRWAPLIETVYSRGKPFGIVVETVNGDVGTTAVGVDSSGSILPSNKTGKPVGKLMITGSAKSKPMIAQYVDALDGLKGLANPYLTSASGETGTFDFSVELDMTTDALGGRFTTKSGKGK